MSKEGMIALTQIGRCCPLPHDVVKGCLMTCNSIMHRQPFFRLIATCFLQDANDEKVDEMIDGEEGKKASGIATGAAVLGGVAGLAVFGVVGAVAGAGALAYASTREDKVWSYIQSSCCRVSFSYNFRYESPGGRNREEWGRGCCQGSAKGQGFRCEPRGCGQRLSDSAGAWHRCDGKQGCCVGKASRCKGQDCRQITGSEVGGV